MEKVWVFGSEQPDKIIPNFTWRREVSKAQYYEELKTIVRGEKFVAMEKLLVIPNNHCVNGFTEEQMKTTYQSLHDPVQGILRRHNDSLHGESYFIFDDIKEIEDT